MNNFELVDIAKEIYAKKRTVYAKGGIGWTLTDYRYSYLYNQYSWNAQHFTPSYKGACACDCSGMIVGMAYDGWRVDKEPVWSKNNDWNDAMLGSRLTDCIDLTKPYNLADVLPGMCLWKSGHVGLYIGDGYAYDSDWSNNGKVNGMTKRKITDVKWAKAGKLPNIEYLSKGGGSSSTIKPGDKIDGTMTVTEVNGNRIIGYMDLDEPIPQIVVGSKVTINPGAKCGGLSSARGRNVSSVYANGKYVDTVTKIEKHLGVEEALLRNIVTWVAVSSLTLHS